MSSIASCISTPRTPLLFLLLIFTFLAAIHCELQQVIEICRHGAREKIYNVLGTPMLYPMGEITEAGLRQHFLLGESLRQIYHDNLSFFPSNYESSQVYIRSSDVNRTIQSALSQLYGLFPLGTGPNISDSVNNIAVPPIPDLSYNISSLGTDSLPMNFQPVAIHTINASNDTLLRGFSASVCPGLHTYYNEAENDSVAQMLYPLFTKTVEAVETLANRSLQGVIKGIQDIEMIFNDVIGDYLNGIPNPVSVNSSLFQDIQILEDFLVYHIQLGSDQELTIANSKLFEEIKSRMEKRISNQPSPRFLLYSAHDITLAGILRAFNFSSWECLYSYYLQNTTSNSPQCNGIPPYASSIIFELHNINSEQYVKMIYNGQMLNFCSNQIYNNMYCPYIIFKQTIGKYIVDDSTYSSLCRRNDTNPFQVKMSSAGGESTVLTWRVIMVLMLNAALIIVVTLLILKKKQITDRSKNVLVLNIPKSKRYVFELNDINI
ncbi:unnamed protein product [Sphagnum balticum]